jgi:hypothetical protein
MREQISERRQQSQRLQERLAKLEAALASTPGAKASSGH